MSAKTASSPDTNGSRLGPEIDFKDIRLSGSGPVGKGSFGEVWRGEVHFNKVAVKIPLVQHLSASELEDLRHECRIMKDRSHANICMFLGASTQPGHFRIVTEMMDGDLDVLIHGNKTVKPTVLTLYQKLKILRDTAKGILWLHKTEPPIIHRDLKPANILVRDEGQGNYAVKVTDFGLSAIKSKNRRLRDDSDGAKGTPLYMSPEVLQLQPFDEKADTYAFGICICEVLTAMDPFAHFDDYEKFKAAVLGGERPPLQSWMTKEMQRFLGITWHHDPTKRYEFHRLVEKLNLFIVEAVFQDVATQNFWKLSFIGEESIPADEFIGKLLAFSNVQIGSMDIGAVSEQPLGAYEYTGDDAPVAPSASSSKKTSEMEKLVLLLKTIFLVNGPSDRITLDRFGRIMQWHGPLTQSPKWIQELKELVKQPWFFGDYPAALAERQLAAEAPGAFLIRFSSNPGSYTVVRKHDSGIGNIRVNKTDQGFEMHNVVYPSLAALANAKQLQMTHPCKGSPFEKFWDL